MPSNLTLQDNHIESQTIRTFSMDVIDPDHDEDLQNDPQFFPLQPTPLNATNVNSGPLISRVPTDIGHHRALLFELATPVVFDQEAWERYWPYIDNVWCLHKKGDSNAHGPTNGKTEKFWGGCRLQRVWKPVEGETRPDGRKRTRRAPGQCPAKFRVTLDVNGLRTLERSKEGHSHDLDYIDSVKRNSGVRGLVRDDFFAGWESGPILAYLKDPANAPPSLPHLLEEAGGKYLDRREIINIFTQKLRASYPGLDQTALKKAKDKYEGVKTCNVKGCNKSFKDAKELAQHKKAEHEQKKHDHSDKMYTCPRKECHRHKRSKGFETMIGLRGHMLKMKHWGMASYHADEGIRMVEAVTEAERHAAEDGEEVAAGRGQESAQQTPRRDTLQPLHSFQSPDMSFLPELPADEGAHMTPMGGHSSVLSIHDGTPAHDSQQKELIMQRLQTLEAEKLRMEQEMDRLRTALFSG